MSKQCTVISALGIKGKPIVETATVCIASKPEQQERVPLVSERVNSSWKMNNCGDSKFVNFIFPHKPSLQKKITEQWRVMEVQAGA